MDLSTVMPVSFPVVLDKALPAIGAISGMLATAFVEARKAKATRADERKKLLLSKLEVLTKAIDDSLRWVTDLGEASSGEDLRKLTNALPTRKVYALAQVYFPSIRSSAADYHEAALKLAEIFLNHPEAVLTGHAGRAIQLIDQGASEQATRAIKLARLKLDAAVQACAEAQLEV